MARLVQTLALAAVLAHMTLGCCLHHWCAWTAAGGGPSACAGRCGHDHGRGDHHGDRPHERGPAPRCCDHEPCSFVRPESSGGLDVLIERQLLSPATLLPETTAAASRSTLDATGPSRVGCREPIRLHLKHQVLLI